MNEAILALEDGRIFRGRAAGAVGTCVGEICFNTSMTGYQEVLTDPSYRGQIVAMTYPLMGNYGTNHMDQESRSPHVRGFVMEEMAAAPSNWRSQMSLSEYLVYWKIPAIEEIDTRALTKHLRTRGAMKACLSNEGRLTDEAAVEKARQGEGVVGRDFVTEVTTAEAYDWDPHDELSREWTLIKEAVDEGAETHTSGEQFKPLGPARYRVVAYDFGVKHNILRRLRQHGFQVRVVPAGTSAEEVLADKPDGVFLSNGPGDPSALGSIHENLRKLIGQTPIFGICLGHQLLGFAYGGKTFKLKFGHRGANQPVKDLRTGKVSITSQNHGFAVDADSLPSSVEVTHLNLNDQTVEGMRHREYPVFSVQYHPEAAPGPNDASYFFESFAKLIESQR